MLSIAKGTPHVSNNSGENEWYTPAEIIEASRRTMINIDLDPASSDKANQTVKASKYFTIEDDDRGITYYWEHLGMLTDDDYRSKWTLKKEWYKRNGIGEIDENPNADKQLVITRDMSSGGIDTQRINTLVAKLFNSAP